MSILYILTFSIPLGELEARIEVSVNGSMLATVALQHHQPFWVDSLIALLLYQYNYPDFKS